MCGLAPAGGALLSSDDYRSRVERTATRHPLWQGCSWRLLLVVSGRASDERLAVHRGMTRGCSSICPVRCRCDPSFPVSAPSASLQGRPSRCWRSSSSCRSWSSCPPTSRPPQRGCSAVGAPNDSTVGGQLTGPLVAADQQPVLPGTVIAVMVKGTKRPVIQAVSFGAVPGRHALPCPGRDPGGQRGRRPYQSGLLVSGLRIHKQPGVVGQRALVPGEVRCQRCERDSDRLPLPPDVHEGQR
jgi:hypothetical protein